MISELLFPKFIFGSVIPVYNQKTPVIQAPLAMSYVPWQSWEALYDESTALTRGTAFPSLDLPFLCKEVRS